MAKKQKLVLLDSHAIIHRAYHALPPMSTKDGVPTQAVYGFAAMLFKVLAQLKPSHVVAAFDVAGPTFRHKAFPDYKAHRAAPDEDLVSQFGLVRKLLDAFGIPVISKTGYEADDVIGTICEQMPEGVEVVIVTGDMDALQLIDDATSVLMLKRGVTDTQLFDAAAVKEKYGFGPEAVVDYKGLRGDASDNIPGLPGVGEKTATDLVREFGSIEVIYEHLDELPKRARTRLEGRQKEAEFSRSLATISRQAPVSLDLEGAKVSSYDTSEVREFLLGMEFHSLLARLPKGGATEAHQESLDNFPSHYNIAQSTADVARLKKRLREASMVAFDTENDRLGAREWPIVGMSFAFRVKEEMEVWYVPVNPESVQKWADVLEDETILKTGHNLKYDALVLRQSGITLGGIVFDSMLAAYLLAPGSRQYGMDFLALQELQHQTIPISAIIGAGKDQKLVSQVPLQALARYAGEDAEVTLRLYETLLPRIQEVGLSRVMDEIEVPLISVLSEMEELGIGVDNSVLKLLNKKVTKEVDRLNKRIQKVAGQEFNVNSTQQLRVILFDNLRLPTVDIKKNQTGWSTAAAELEKLRGAHEIIPLIEQYRELAKLLNTYISTLPELVAKDGRIHTSFNQTIAATGRLSSTDPNLQNIPVRTEWGQEVRKAFVAAQGKCLIKADYSQMELRLAAHLAQDKAMMEVFVDGGDIHTATAGWVYGVEAEAVTSEQRRQAKTLNFGVLYGMGANNFARAAGISREEARAFIGRYQDQYERLMEYIDETVAMARELGYTETLFGRRRYLPEIASSNPAVAASAERMAFNFPVQGTEADILKVAMIALARALREKFKGASLVLTVHDELVVEASIEDAQKVGAVMKTEMEGVMTLDVPIIVDVATGVNWQEMTELDMVK